nr:TonB-dependent receptor [Shinella yambaruensis]
MRRRALIIAAAQASLSGSQEALSTRAGNPSADSLETVFQTQVGLYAQDQVRIDNWVLSFAGRYDWVETDVDDVASNIQNPGGRDGDLFHAIPCRLSTR